MLVISIPYSIDIMTVSHCTVVLVQDCACAVQSVPASGCPAAAGKLAGVALCCCWRHCSSPEDLTTNTVVGIV